MNQPTFNFPLTPPDSCNIMGRRLKGVAAHDHTKTKSKSNPSASPEVVLLHRLDLIDVRLNQLEEKQRVPESYFAADLRRAAVNFGQRQCRSFSSALQEVHIKGTLMDRLRLLENRILQVGYELDKGSGSSSSTSTSAKSSDESTWMLNPKSCKSDDATPQHHGQIRGPPKKTGDQDFQRSGGGGDGSGVSTQLQTNKSLSKKVKGTKDGCKTAEKKGSRSQNGKKRVDHNRTYKRWFGLGC